MKFVLFAFVCAGLLSQGAFANDLLSARHGMEMMDSNQGPQPIEPGHFRYADLKPVYVNGKSTSQAVLQGSWKMIAMASTAVCGFFLKNTYDPAGIKNQDSSIESLTFDTYTVPAVPGSGEAAKSIFGVKVTNAGAKTANQGPYAVDSKEPQFSQYAYIYNETESHLSTGAYITNGCRISAADATILTCLQKLVITDTTNVASDSIQCANDAESTAVIIYKKN